MFTVLLSREFWPSHSADGCHVVNNCPDVRKQGNHWLGSMDLSYIRDCGWRITCCPLRPQENIFACATCTLTAMDLHNDVAQEYCYWYKVCIALMQTCNQLKSFYPEMSEKWQATQWSWIFHSIVFPYAIYAMLVRLTKSGETYAWYKNRYDFRPNIVIFTSTTQY